MCRPVQPDPGRSVQVTSGEMPQQFVGCNIQRAVTSVATGDCFQGQIETDQISCNSRTASAPAAFRASVHVISKYSPAELVEVLKAIIFRANQPMIKTVFSSVNSSIFTSCELAT